MPSSITHHLIAESAKQVLPPYLWQTASIAPDYFFLGAQGPDLFFFLDPHRGKRRNLGRLLHRERVYDLFSALADGVRKFSGENYTRALAYCLGYVSHYSADTVFHPLLYRYLEQTGLPRRVHQQVESDWDVYFARTRAAKEAENYFFPFLPKRIAREGVLFRLLRCVTERLHLPPVSAAALKNALVRFGKFLSFFHKNGYARRKRWAKLEEILHVRWLADFFPREDPDPESAAGRIFRSEEAGRNADEFFDRASRDSARRMELFFRAAEGAALPREEFSRHLLTGEPL